MNKTNLLYLIIAFLLILWLFDHISGCNRASQATSFLNSLQDTLHKERNAKGQEIASIATIYTSEIKDLKGLVDSKDSTLNKLKRIVDKKTLSATILSNTTTDKGVTNTIVTHDTSNSSKNSSSSKPIYSTSWHDQWSEGSITATADSITRHFIVHNQFELKTYTKGGLFKKETVISTVTNLNPYTETTELRTFQIKCNCNKTGYFSAGLIAGSLITLGIQRLK